MSEKNLRTGNNKQTEDSGRSITCDRSSEVVSTENILRRHIKDDPQKKILAKHRIWLDSLQHEYPMPHHPFRIGVYIRYYNQTRHKNYIEKHIQQFTDDIALCKQWTLVGFYVDKGLSAPRMENSKEWCRLLEDCFSGKVDLIVTQKVSNVSSDADEITFIARILAAQKHPVGIYFISEDIFTLASYYRGDMNDRYMFPPNFKPLPDDEYDIYMRTEDEDSALIDTRSDESDDSI